MPTLVVTRPEPQCSAWVARLQALGQPARALPLLRIETVPEFAATLAAAWDELSAADAAPGGVRLKLVMFVSPNAVEQFFARRPSGCAWPLDVLAGATGPGTVAALQAHGVPLAAIAAPRADATQFDADTLWQHALAQRAWAGTKVLIVRGEAGRDWLATTLRTHGAEVQMLAAYRQAPPLWDAVAEAQLAAVLAAPQAHGWLFSSSQAVRHLLEHCVPPAGAESSADVAGNERLAALLAVPVLATHPRIAETAVAAGFRHVNPVRPEIEQIVTAAQNLLDTMPAAGRLSCPPSL
jgi:uroporphyrinogen-III synthase